MEIILNGIAANYGWANIYYLIFQPFDDIRCLNIYVFALKFLFLLESLFQLVN